MSVAPFRSVNTIPHFRTSTDRDRSAAVDVHGNFTEDQWEVGDLCYIEDIGELAIFNPQLAWEALSSSMSVLVAPDLATLRTMPAVAGQLGWVANPGQHYAFDGTSWIVLGSKSTLLGMLTDGGVNGTTDVATLTSSTATQRGSFYLYSGPDHTPAAGALAGIDLHQGDTITATPGAGTNGWSIMSGSGALTKQRAVQLFGLHRHDPTQSYEVGALVVDGQAILAADADLGPKAFDPADWTTRYAASLVEIDTEANRPAVGMFGMVYVATDTGVVSVWEPTAAAGAGGWDDLLTIPLENFPDIATRLEGDVLTWDATNGVWRRIPALEALPLGTADGQILRYHTAGAAPGNDVTLALFGGPAPGGVVDLATLRADTTYGDAAKVASGDPAMVADEYVDIAGAPFTWDGTTWQDWVAPALPGGWAVEAGATTFAELTDTDTTTTAPTDGQVPAWDDAQQLWVPADMVAGGEGRITYVGAGPFDSVFITDPAQNYGLPVATVPDPTVTAPIGGDLYIDTGASTITVFEGPDDPTRAGGTLTGFTMSDFGEVPAVATPGQVLTSTGVDQWGWRPGAGLFGGVVATTTIGPADVEWPDLVTPTGAVTTTNIGTWDFGVAPGTPGSIAVSGSSSRTLLLTEVDALGATAMTAGAVKVGDNIRLSGGGNDQDWEVIGTPVNVGGTPTQWRIPIQLAGGTSPPAGHVTVGVTGAGTTTAKVRPEDFAVGAYLAVVEAPASGTTPASWPGPTSAPVAVGDYLIVVDTDGDGVGDAWLLRAGPGGGGGGDVELIHHEGAIDLTEVQIDFDWATYCQYAIEFAMEGAMSTESDSAHQFLGTQTSSETGTVRYGIGVSANTVEQVLPDGDKVGRLIIGREMNQNRMEMTVTPAANEYISIAGKLDGIKSTTGHLKIINASGWMEVTVTAVKG